VEIWQGVLLFATGIAAGFLNVMAGGGSLLTVPVMVFLGLPGPVANGTNRIAILAQNVTAVVTFFRRGMAEFRLSLMLALCTVPGAVAGALAGTHLEGVWFERTLAVIMLAVMILTSLGRKIPPAQAVSSQSRGRLAAGCLLMIVVGVYGGFIQVGVGFILIPVLQRVLGMDLVRVNMHKVFIVGVYTVVALIVFSTRVQVMWLLGLALAAGTTVGGWLGAHTSVSKGERVIRIVLNTVLIAFIIKLLFL
jgi:uncharacterized membrane protein YfcA